MTLNTARTLPDVANEAGPLASGRLDWVGMDEIVMPLRLAGSAADLAVPARIRAAVNLTRPDIRGIHMSRLYLHVDRALSAEPVSQSSLRHLLRNFLESHADPSDSALLRASFPLMLRRRALRSENSGWRTYPVTVEAVLVRGQFTVELGVEVVYSSTCQASAALARQEIQEAFLRYFPTTDRSIAIRFTPGWAASRASAQHHTPSAAWRSCAPDCCRPSMTSRSSTSSTLSRKRLPRRCRLPSNVKMSKRLRCSTDPI